LIDDLPLFQVAVRREDTNRKPSKVEENLKAMSLDDMTPREALDALYDLKKHLS
jgi:DNA mismatch repair protein MutS